MHWQDLQSHCPHSETGAQDCRLQSSSKLARLIELHPQLRCNASRDDQCQSNHRRCAGENRQKKLQTHGAGSFSESGVSLLGIGFEQDGQLGQCGVILIDLLVNFSIDDGDLFLLRTFLGKNQVLISVKSTDILTGQLGRLEQGFFFCCVRQVLRHFKSSVGFGSYLSPFFARVIKSWLMNVSATMR